MILQDEVKIMALTDLISNLKKCRELAKIAGFGWEMDDELCTMINHSEHELDELS